MTPRTSTSSDSTGEVGGIVHGDVGEVAVARGGGCVAGGSAAGVGCGCATGGGVGAGFACGGVGASVVCGGGGDAGLADGVGVVVVTAGAGGFDGDRCGIGGTPGCDVCGRGSVVGRAGCGCGVGRVLVVDSGGFAVIGGGPSSGGVT